MKIGNVLSGGPLNSAREETMQIIDNFVYKVAKDGSGAFGVRIPNTTFIYPDNRTVPPLNVPPLAQTNSEIQTWAIVISYLAFVILVALAGAFLVWMQRHLDTDPLRSAQPFLCAS
jgi:nitrate reductase NapE component